MGKRRENQQRTKPVNQNQRTQRSQEERQKRKRKYDYGTTNNRRV